MESNDPLRLTYAKWALRALVAIEHRASEIVQSFQKTDLDHSRHAVFSRFWTCCVLKKFELVSHSPFLAIGLIRSRSREVYVILVLG